MPAAITQSREELIERHLLLAERIARRYAHTKEPLDDLVQVARVGLMKAAARWDADRGTAFSTYAVATMSGELRRYFRDATWAVRPPRALQELCLEVARARDALMQELGREPSAHDVALWLGREVAEVVEALQAGRAYTAQSLDAPRPAGDEDAPSAGELLVDSRDELSRCEDAAVIEQLCSRLRRCDRELVRLHYQEDLVQAEIAERVGRSQMHVSRRLRAALLELQASAGAR